MNIETSVMFDSDLVGYRYIRLCSILYIMLSLFYCFLLVWRTLSIQIIKRVYIYMVAMHGGIYIYIYIYIYIPPCTATPYKYILA